MVCDFTRAVPHSDNNTTPSATIRKSQVFDATCGKLKAWAEDIIFNRIRFVYYSRDVACALMNAYILGHVSQITTCLKPTGFNSHIDIYEALNKVDGKWYHTLECQDDETDDEDDEIDDESNEIHTSPGAKAFTAHVPGRCSRGLSIVF